MDTPTGSPSDATKNARRPRRVIWVVLGVAAVLVVVISAVGSLPAVCSACHSSQAKAMAKTGHDEIDCYGCHLEDGLWGVPQEKATEFRHMYPLALIGAGLKNPATATARSECLSCHVDVLKKTTTSGGLSIKHRYCAPGPTCDTCHSAVAHPGEVRWGQSAVMEDCVACHEKEGVSVECETCHTGDRGERERARGPWQVTHGRDWQKTHGAGDLSSCDTCHPEGFCAKCHGVSYPHTSDFGATHGQKAIENPSACEVCHKSQEAFCDACHGMPMPHPDSFTAEHTTIATSNADPKCLRCHVETDCDTCHTYHVHPGGAQGVPVPWTLTPEDLRP